MDAAVAALLGLLIGGSLALGMAQRLQTRSQLLAQEIRRRQQLYGEFIEAAVCCYAGALQGERADAGSLAWIHNEIMRMRHHSSGTIVKEAIRIADKIGNAYGDPKRTGVGTSLLRGDLMELVGDFSDACRAELLCLQRHGVAQEPLRRCGGPTRQT